MENLAQIPAYQRSKFKKIMLIISLLLLNILEQAPNVVNATIPSMARTFANQSLAWVESITTVTNMFVTVFVLLSGFIVNKIGQKQTAVLGIFIASVAAVIPSFSNSFVIVIVSRAVLGIGIGLAHPLAVSLIGSFFTGDEFLNVMGWRSAMGGVGTALMTYIAGQLLKCSWHMSFLVYLLFIPALLLFLIFVPEPEKFGLQKQKPEANINSKESSVPEKKSSKLPIFALALLLFLFLIGATIFGVKLANYFVSSKIGTATQASTVLSIFQFSQMIGGFLFAFAYKRLHVKLLPIAILLRGLPLIVISAIRSIPVITAMAFVFGLAGGMTMALVFTLVKRFSTPKTAPINNAIPLAGSNLGAFVTPFVAKYLGNTPGMTIQNAGFLYLVVTIIIVIILVVINHKGKTTELNPV